MESWIPEFRDHFTNRETSLGFRFDVSMRGALGIGVDIAQLTETELKEFETHIAFYKEIRETVQKGEPHRLKCYDNEERISIWQFVDREGLKSVYSEIHTGIKSGKFYKSPPLRNLLNNANYCLRDAHGEFSTIKKGFELMTFGLPLIESVVRSHQPLRSRSIYIEKV